ncbi:MAG: swr1 complex component [Pycnora praestabilis]|nr:MAG: swr1 complex component [Pycnora praestabilis]
MRSRSRSGVSNHDTNGEITHGEDPSTQGLSVCITYCEDVSKTVPTAIPAYNGCANHNDEPPNKKRKLTDVRSHSPPRPISPPWKKIAVEGPTSFVEGGRRKSSRTNAVPLELQPQAEKRQTRAAVQNNALTKNSKVAKPKPRSFLATSQPSPSLVNGKRSQTRGKSLGQVAGKSPGKPNVAKIASPKSPTSKLSPLKPRPPSFAKPATPSKSAGQTMQTRRSVRTSEVATAEKEKGMADKIGLQGTGLVEADRIYKPQKLRFRVRMPTVPIQHPGHIVPPRQFASFQEWLKHDDPLSQEPEARVTEEDAIEEASIRQRILQAARAGGVLSEEKCSVHVPEPQEEPDRQYAHQDYLIAQALHFRKLLKQEQRHHLASAKRIAIAAAAEWKRRQPKTDEERLQEQHDASITRYKQLRRDLQAKWDMVNTEVRKRKLVRWEEEQQVLGKQALNHMLEQSTQLLDKRRLGRSSENGSDEEEDEEEDDDEELSKNEGSGSDAEDESNMSASESESEEGAATNGVDDDEGLTVDELRQKYAALPEDNLDGVSATDSHHETRKKKLAALLEKDRNPNREVDLSEDEVPDAVVEMAGVDIEEVDAALMDKSDDSTDMDDDMINSDENQDYEDEEEYGEEEEHPGLLGFFSKKELDFDVEPDSGNKETADEHLDEDEPEEEDTEEVSMIPDASQVQTPSASNIEEQTTSDNKEIPILDNAKDSTPDMDMVSGDPSSQASPGTNATTKPSEAESISSMDMQLDSKHHSSPATPQPTALKTPIPSLLRGTLREYQHYGLDWLAGLYSNHTNGILADEMGLGKTIQTIALLAHLAVEHEVWGPHLVVVPTSVMLNWEMEFKKWCPGFKILTYYGTQEERKQKRKGWQDDNLWNVCITSYQLVLQDQQTFKRRNWHYMVLDEAHNIKNFRSQRWQTLLTFKTRARLLLTGTPLQNNLTELWSLLFFLMPSDSTENGIGGFADLKEFSDWFRKPVEQILEHGRDMMDDEAKQIVFKLHKVLRPYLLRRLKADVEKQMPGKYEHVVYCRLSKRQRYLYDGFMSLSQTRETLTSGNYLSIINCLMQLRKVCNHPDLFETRQIVTSFAMQKPAVADFEIKELLVRRRLLQEKPMTTVNLDFLNLVPTSSENTSMMAAKDSSKINAIRMLQDLCSRQRSRIDWRMVLNASTVNSTQASMENTSRMSRLEELRHCVYLNALRSQQRPIYGSGLINLLTLDLVDRPLLPQPKHRAQLSEWLINSSPVMRDLVPTLSERSAALKTTIQKFACITPAAVAIDMAPLALTRQGVEVVRDAQQMYGHDAFHEARSRLSIAFPDKRLLQYDCGKLQRLAVLLRDLQAGGHRALIFTQMTKVLDILEQFLNIHGHRYLRLDGSTKIEQRQILTDRFNNDTRILAFILSTRSGGLGINLTGADTVIFYDLDWNPAMDKQCQDRCHRIGQTRDVHIYRFVSEYTIESNILRKANQKRMLDDVVIQEGEFTTDYFNKLSVRDMLGDEAMDGDAEANAAMDRVLGGSGRGTSVEKVLEQAEDKEDRDAAEFAEKEMVHTDDADFDEKAAALDNSSGATPRTPGPPTPRDIVPLSGSALTPNTTTAEEPGIEVVETTTTIEAAESGLVTHGTVIDVEMTEAEIEEPGHIDEYMLRFMEWELRDIEIAPAIDKSKKKAKKGQAHRVINKGGNN